MSRQNLLPPYLAANPAWVQLTEAIDAVFQQEVDLPTQLLAKLRDNWILSDTAEAKVGGEQMLDNEDWFRFERETLIRQANQIGFLLRETDLLTDVEYQRLVRNLGAFWFNKGTPGFINFIRYVLGAIIDIRKLFSLPGPTYDTYGLMLEEGDPGIGRLNWEYEEILTPLLSGSADTVANGGPWSLGPNITRQGTVTGPTGLLDGVIYQSTADAGSSLLLAFPFENNTHYRLEVWLRKLGGLHDTLGIIGADSDFNGDGALERVSHSVNPIPLVWAKYTLDFTTGALATSTPDFLYALTDFLNGVTVAVAQPQLYKVTDTATPGQWFETSHVHMIVDPLAYVPQSLQKMIALFNVLANYDLVLDSVVFEMIPLIHPPGGTIGEIVKAYVIVDIETTIYSARDPSPPSVASVSSPTAVEGGTMTFTVTLNKSSSIPFSVGYTRTGTATAGTDFTGPTLSNNCLLTGGIIQVPADTLSFTIAFAILTDVVADPGETIIVNVGGQTGTGTIT
jgi:hypothetical protein